MQVNKLNKLYEIAANSDIRIDLYNFSDTKKAMCLYEDGQKSILLDMSKIETGIEETVILAEEVGHHETLGLYMVKLTEELPIARCNRLKYEAWAKRWGVREILPSEEIQEALNCGYRSDCEIAEYCDVTLDFVKYAFQYYSQKRVKFKYRWYT